MGSDPVQPPDGAFAPARGKGGPEGRMRGSRHGLTPRTLIRHFVPLFAVGRKFEPLAAADEGERQGLPIRPLTSTL